MLKLQGYDFTIVYHPASERILADTLSHLPNTKKNNELELDNWVDTILTENISNIATDLINFSPVKQNHIWGETASDPILNSPAQLIYTGWPEVHNELPTDLREF